MGNQAGKKEKICRTKEMQKHRKSHCEAKTGRRLNGRSRSQVARSLKQKRTKESGSKGKMPE